MNSDARFLYLFLCAGLLIHGYAAYKIVGILPGYDGSFYWFTVPHLALLPVAIAAVAFDAFRGNATTLRVVKICLACSIPTFLFAMILWSGGDDGPGMAWEYFIGSASFINVAAGFPIVNLAHKCRWQST